MPSHKSIAIVNNYDEAGTNTMMNSAFGEEEVVKKKTRHSKPVGTEGAASIGGDGMVNKRRIGSVSTKNIGAVRKRKIVSSR